MVNSSHTGEIQKAGVPAQTDAAELKKLARRLGAETAERKRLEQELHSLPNKIISAQDTERRRIARELHDGVNQLLATIKIRLMHVESKIAREAPAHAESVTEARKLLERAVTEVRRISSNLRPAELDDFGLIAAVERLIRDFEERSRIVVDLKKNLSAKRFGKEVELAFYRIIQEALANVAEHAQARTVAVGLIGDGKFATLNIRDDGIGFVEEKAPEKDRGLGIISMRERVNALGGVFSIKSKPGRGTEISVHVKLL